MNGIIANKTNFSMTMPCLPFVPAGNLSACPFSYPI